MKFSVITCQRAEKLFGSAPRHYGYTLQIDPPKQLTLTGDDIEGIGWVPFNPPKNVTKFWQGWYKNKQLAEQRASELNEA